MQAQVISPEHNYAQNSAGIVMVQSVFSATVYVNKVEMNERMFDKLVDSVKRLDTTGKILSPGLRLDIVVNALNRTPLRYFSAGRQYFRQVHRVQTAGTGFLVTGDGYLVTNCHVIDRDSAFIRNKFILETFQEVTESNINALQSSWAMKLSDQQRNLLYNAYGLIYSQVSSMILFDLKKEIFVLYRGDSTLDKTITIKKKARVIIKGQPMPGKDVAILKIDDVKDLPALVVSSDLAIQIGTQVLVFGYPEPVTSNSFLDTESGLEPSLTTGIISAVKKSIGGWPVIQMDVLISHGSSGSPVCNDKGEVIGLATFGSLDPGSSGLASGFNFAIPVSVLKEFLDSVSLQPSLSHASMYFNQGLVLFFNQFYSRAKDKFERAKKLNEQYPQLSFYIDQCNNKIVRGVDKQSPPRKYVLWIMLVIAILIGFYLVFLKKKLRNG
ncbi:MAG TPA: serine protease [Chitinophagaceae bacterium]|nr:serine protease [Chitinophagaceae bacterium]